jgi:hypothetical protein
LAAPEARIVLVRPPGIDLPEVLLAGKRRPEVDIAAHGCKPARIVAVVSDHVTRAGETGKPAKAAVDRLRLRVVRVGRDRDLPANGLRVDGLKRVQRRM